MIMNKADLVNYVAEQSSLTKKDALKTIETVFSGITQTLKTGKEARFIGFGSFSVQKSSARKGRHPRTGETIQIAASTRPIFRAGKEFKDAVKSN